MLQYKVCVTLYIGSDYEILLKLNNNNILHICVCTANFRIIKEKLPKTKKSERIYNILREPVIYYNEMEIISLKSLRPHTRRRY